MYSIITPDTSKTSQNICIHKTKEDTNFEHQHHFAIILTE